MEQKNQITEGVIWKQLLIFFFPIVIGTFFQQVYNTADSIVVGRFVGKEALAAVSGSVNQIVTLIVEVFVGLTSGASVIIAQFYGAKDHKNLNRTLHTAYAFAIVTGAIVGLIGFWITEKVLIAMKTPSELMADSVIYLHIYFCGMIFNIVYNMGASILRAVGDSRRPLYVLSCNCDCFLSGNQCMHGNVDFNKGKFFIPVKDQGDSFLYGIPAVGTSHWNSSSTGSNYVYYCKSDYSDICEWPGNRYRCCMGNICEN